jgi:hypothetical protein
MIEAAIILTPEIEQDIIDTIAVLIERSQPDDLKMCEAIIREIGRTGTIAITMLIELERIQYETANVASVARKASMPMTR